MIELDGGQGLQAQAAGREHRLPAGEHMTFGIHRNRHGHSVPAHDGNGLVDIAPAEHARVAGGLAEPGNRQLDDVDAAIVAKAWPGRARGGKTGGVGFLGHVITFGCG